MTDERVKEIIAEVSEWLTGEPLESGRVLLRPFEEGDFDDFCEYRSQPELLRLSGMDAFKDEAEAKSEFAKLTDRSVPTRDFAVVYKQTGKVIGNFGINIYPFVKADKELENKKGVSLSFVLNGDYQRLGIMTGLLLAAFEDFFVKHDLDFVNCGHFVFNEGSRRLQERVGMHYYMDHVFPHNGEEIQTRENIIFRDDYFAQHYTNINSATIDRWVAEGWEWGIPVTHEVCDQVRSGNWSVVLTPTKPVPKSWFGDLKGKRVFGLASGGGQQMPVFALLGAECWVLDNSAKQIESEIAVAKREGYEIHTVCADMTKPLPFEDGFFDIIFHPVSNCYIREVLPVWRECARVLKKGGRLLAGLDNGFNFLFGEDESHITENLPFDPITNSRQREDILGDDCGMQFSHTISEQIAGQIKAGFKLLDVYDDTNGTGFLHEHGVPTFWATLAVKE